MKPLIAIVILFLACGSSLSVEDPPPPPPPPPPGSAVPLTDLGPGLYLGRFQGGLYPGGSNEVPADHAALARRRLPSMQPRDLSGTISPSGKIVLVSIGMSTTTQIFCHANWKRDDLDCNSWSFTGQALADSDVDHSSLIIFNGAMSEQTSEDWDDPSEYNYARVDSMLYSRGLSPLQIQVAVLPPIVRRGNATDTVLPDTNANAYRFERDLGDVVRAMRARWPNIQFVFLDAYMYGGHDLSGVVLEPRAYEGGFAVKWLIEAQIQQARTGQIDPLAGDLSPVSAPWLAWGPYWWAEGDTPRADGLMWLRSDYESDGRHPSESGETKAAALLLEFLKSSPFTQCWFLAGRSCS
jgi:hypothetical protein